MSARPDNRTVSSQLVLTTNKITIEFLKEAIHSRSDFISIMKKIAKILQKHGFEIYDKSQEYNNEGAIDYVSSSFNADTLLIELREAGWSVKQV